MRYILSFTLLFFSLYYGVFAQELKVGTIEREPFSYKQDGVWTGFSIDLFREIAERNNIDYSFREFEEFSKMLTETKQGGVDLSAANISITLEREKILDFSQPIFDSGLNILSLAGIPAYVFLSPVVTDNILKVIIFIGLGLIGLVHYFFLLNVIKGNISMLSYFKEIFSILFEVLWQIKRSYGLRLLIVTLVTVSVLGVSYFSQKAAIAFADHEDALMQAGVSEYKNIDTQDLKKLRVGVTYGSTSMRYLDNQNIKYTGYRQFQTMISELEAGEIDVVVHDDPLLRYLAANDEGNNFVTTGKTFQPEKFGFVFPESSGLREKFDRSILEILEDGTYEKIYNTYFK